MLMPVMSETWKLDSDKIILGDKLGKGNFGDVCKGYLKIGGIQLEVAVKTCHDTLPDEQKSKFLEEATIMKSYNHPNIVRCIGVCSQSAQEMIVMEYLPGLYVVCHVYFIVETCFISTSFKNVCFISNFCDTFRRIVEAFKPPLL